MADKKLWNLIRRWRSLGRDYDEREKLRDFGLWGKYSHLTTIGMSLRQCADDLEEVLREAGIPAPAEGEADQ